MVIELKIALVDIGYFAGLTPAGNSQFNLGKSRDEFKSKMKQGSWWTPITLHKEDSSFIMDERTISIKGHSLCLLLQVTFALSHVCIEHDKQKLC